MKLQNQELRLLPPFNTGFISRIFFTEKQHRLTITESLLNALIFPSFWSHVRKGWGPPENKWLLQDSPHHAHTASKCHHTSISLVLGLLPPEKKNPPHSTLWQQTEDNHKERSHLETGVHIFRQPQIHTLLWFLFRKIPLTLLERQRQADGSEFKNSLVYIASSKPARDRQADKHRHTHIHPLPYTHTPSPQTLNIFEQGIPSEIVSTKKISSDCTQDLDISKLQICSEIN